MAKYIPKINFCDFRGSKPTFFKATAEKFGMRVRVWDSLPYAKFCKNCLRGYNPLGKFIPKINNLAIFAPISPHFKATTVTFTTCYMSSHFWTHSVKILLKRWDSINDTKSRTVQSPSSTFNSLTKLSSSTASSQPTTTATYWTSD